MTTQQKLNAEYKDNTAKRFAFENAMDCMYYGYGQKDWNSCGLNEQDRKEVWHKAFEYMSRDDWEW